MIVPGVLFGKIPSRRYVPGKGKRYFYADDLT